MTLVSAKPRFEQNRLTVPYISAWEPELVAMPQLTTRQDMYGRRLAFVDEGPMDRDQHFTLWRPQGLARGQGKAVFEAVHSLRQRRCMFDLLCQVCGGSTLEEDFDRQLYVMNSANGVPIQEGERTMAPPICTGCAPEAVASCPRLYNRFVAAYVERSYPWGVYGVLYDPFTLLPVTGKPVEVPYDDVRLRWMVAHRKVSTLHRVTAVDLTTLTAASNSP
ncbi:hypothetical protein [Streptomyces sp. NPDC059928]|uniref:hypothetical protein n=1 Tax=unclassified Streptomyces TaxID=2593676 RepID=UPI00364B6FA6